jgi:hypothetical protein
VASPIASARLQTNSAAFPLLGRLIPLIGGQIPLFCSVGNLTLDPNGINGLRGRFRSAKSLNVRFSLFFPGEQGIRPLSSDDDRSEFSRHRASENNRPTTP